MKRILSIFAATIVLINCDERKPANPVSTLPLSHNSIHMKIGDSWLYKRMFINIGATALGYPDTMVGYAYFEATKDTVIDSQVYLIVNGREYDVAKDTINVYTRRSAIHFTDSGISMFEFKSDFGGSMTGVLKRGMSNYQLTTNNYGTRIFKLLELQKMMTASPYNTAVFSDFVYPILFPLQVDSIYTYRPAGDPNSNVFYRRKFLGIDRITVQVGSYDTYKFEWLIKEAMGIDSVYGFDWIGENGILRSYWDMGVNDLYDSVGIKIGTLRSYDFIDKTGYKDINPDTLVPWGRRNVSTIN